MHSRDKRNGESDDERAAAERNLHRDVKTKLFFTWPELGRDVKPRSDESFRIQSYQRELQWLSR